jgi:hypothetical protein
MDPFCKANYPDLNGNGRTWVKIYMPTGKRFLVFEEHGCWVRISMYMQLFQKTNVISFFTPAAPVYRLIFHSDACGANAVKENENWL